MSTVDSLAFLRGTTASQNQWPLTEGAHFAAHVAANSLNEAKRKATQDGWLQKAISSSPAERPLNELSPAIGRAYRFMRLSHRQTVVNGVKAANLNCSTQRVRAI
jgi:hypothetical protein